MRKAAGLWPAFLSLLISMLVLGAVVERTALVSFFNGHAAANTGTVRLSQANHALARSPMSAASLVTVPDVTCWAAAPAQEAIEGSGLMFVARHVHDAAVPVDVVATTDPAPGRQLPLGSQVIVTVSTGPPANVKPSPRCATIVHALPPGFFSAMTPPPAP